ncbi:filamentous hemagglutinin N-terminal domain-containing protein [Aetokthonos hydrillicola Thurmond2011]|uniref:Filamentous hemagglutinin N-terminal domain-containing protein n=1 Tax=Aetokthonos hydrillicola Thurmond2011 TaxID=2712845 RepID=A0AAP5IB62_9CYAN|nr:filamentous hemagglutinin N-terminal domain-containing protein [Aetokthonos hydrillicola CCALA 1050]MBW4587994.1 filamentous hemagglutinin N-terminal domain-containing protein [Aetokthonos hydrillicola CCALA 1050]MDR9897054.1 filamentous hemagglutinin N-terminal domain-containing protein [Aetokthonos hydrillicola Thurmond2011]
MTCFAFLAIAINSFENYALAQIKPDNTLSNNSTVTIQGTTSLVEGGTRRGNNLFHSFTTFSVPGGNTVYFNNSPAIRNILTRVTGGFASEIDGVLRANGTANLFLLNPNGIVFGSNASLNIGGSFTASTADSFLFGDGTQFSATNPQTIPLLTVNVPIGLQFGYKPGNIVVKGQGQSLGLNGAAGSFENFVGLQVKPGKTLALIGGNVQLDGGLLQAPGGHVQLGGLSEPGTVTFQENGSFVFPTGVIPSDVSLINKSGVNVLDSSGGSISINARNINISGASLLSSGITSGLGAVGNQAGDITLNAMGNVTLRGSRIENNANPNAIGNSGNINVTASSISLTDNAALDGNTSGQGNGGKVNINARDAVSLDNSYLLSPTGSGSVGNGGDINITTGSLSLKNNSQLVTDLAGRGNGGNINISTRDIASFNFSAITSLILPNGVGNSGTLNINTGSLLANNLSQFNLSVTNGGQGKAGNVNINAQGLVTFDGGFIFSRLEKGGVGRGGDINITTNSLTVTGVPPQVQAGSIGQLVTATFGKGDAGNVTIKASDTVTFSGKGSDVYSLVGTNRGIGNGGNITINSRVLSITNDARLVAQSETEGKAGNIIINTEKLLLNSTYSTNGATISSNFLSTSSKASSTEAGSIDIRAGVILLRGSSGIVTSTYSSNGGDIGIQSNNLVLLDNSVIASDAVRATGGRVIIDTEGILRSSNSIISARGENPSLTGTVEIKTQPNTDPTQGLVKLPTNLVEASRLIAQVCPVNGSHMTNEQSRFTITGQGGLPPTPREAVSSESLLEDWGQLSNITAERSPNSNQPSKHDTNSSIERNAPFVSDSLIEAQGWVIDEHGDVVLTATPPTVTSHKPLLTPAACHDS